MSASASTRIVGRVLTLSKKVMNPGFSAYRLSADDIRFDPFMNVDHFFMSAATFPPHPHAGFNAITVLLPDSQGSFTNRDSLGASHVIRPGDTQWTTAGSGVVHEEIPEVEGVMGHGLQVFLNLASEHKQATPQCLPLPASETPIFNTPGGGTVRVIAGETNGAASPLNPKVLTKATLLDVTLPKGATLSHAVPADHNLVAMVVKGSVAFGAKGAQKTLSAEQVCDFDLGTTLLEAEGASDEPCQFVLFSGKPTGQQLVWRGPFCGDSTQQVAGYVAAYQAGVMGQLTPSPVFQKRMQQ